MKITTRVTFLVNKDNRTSLVIEDDDAVCRFLEMEITNDQLVALLSRQAYIKIEAKVDNLDIVGKKREHKKFEFEIPENVRWYTDKSTVVEIGKKLCPEGWTMREHFNSQDSHFTKDGKTYARTSIMRWVDKE